MPRAKKLPRPRIPPEELKKRIQAYTKVSTLKDPGVAHEAARSIVLAEFQRDALVRELEDEGVLSDDKNRSLTSLHGTIDRLRRKAGIMVLRDDDDDERNDAGAGLAGDAGGGAMLNGTGGHGGADAQTS